MAKAIQLLNNQEETVTQIAYAVGFDNPSYFTKVFKERYAVLPSQYGNGGLWATFLFFNYYFFNQCLLPQNDV